MSITLLNKKHTRMRVKEIALPFISSPILGHGIDVTALPEGHLSCPMCKKHLFEASLYGDNHRIEMGCISCNWSCRLLFPLDVSLPEKQGRFTCKKHPTKGMVCIHNVDTISIGCESCKTEINIKVKTKSNLILAN